MLPAASRPEAVRVPELVERLQQALADRYRIERELGRGGFATVYLATDLKHQRPVALKVLHPELAVALGSARFLREIATVAQFRHPHILPLHDSGDADGLLYYVMPFVEGESLRQRLEREPQLPLENALQVTREVADALGYAHGLGVVHRDVKPENILFEAGHAIVTDFGIARAVQAAGTQRLTETGLAVGTPAYMSPEQAAGDPALDGRSDIYSLACVLYEMLAGAPPFGGPTPQTVLAAQIGDPVPSLRALRPAVPLGVERAVEKALAKTAAERYATAEEFVQHLTRASTAEAVATELRRERARRRWRALLTVAGVVLVAAAGWWAVGAVQRATGHATIKRLAVLPLAGFTNDTSQEYFVDGVHDALISDLQEAGLTVLGRTSVLRYRRTEEPPRQIARQLGVDALIEGSVMRAGDSVEVSVRLIDGRTEVARWEHRYAGTVRNVLALYHGVTRAIAEQVHSALSPAAAARLAAARTVDPQAYDDYLKGLVHWQQLTPSGLDAALQYFEAALMRDSAYAPAYAGITLVWVGRAVSELVPGREALPKAVAAAQRAMGMDSDLAEVQYAAAHARWWQWNWVGAEAAFRKAIQINPSLPDAHALYSHLLNVLGRPKEARAEMNRALALDPFNALFRAASGVDFLYERRYDDAIAEFRRALEEGDQTVATNIFLAYHAEGRYAEALAAVRKAFAGDREVQDSLDRGYAEGGYRAALRRAAEALGGRTAFAAAGPFSVAELFGLAGDKRRTMEWLERSYAARDPNLSYLGLPPAFDLLQDDPRLRDLRRRMNLPT
jgi:TolB-like protein/Flp pilus assembly protein TadD